MGTRGIKHKRLRNSCKGSRTSWLPGWGFVWMVQGNRAGAERRWPAGLFFSACFVMLPFQLRCVGIGALEIDCRVVPTYLLCASLMCLLFPQFAATKLKIGGSICIYTYLLTPDVWLHLVWVAPFLRTFLPLRDWLLASSTREHAPLPCLIAIHASSAPGA